MITIAVTNLKKEFVGEVLFEDISFTLNEKDRLAILGANGTGKTTLLRMILGREEITGGQVAIAKTTSVGYLSQEVIVSKEHTLYEEARLVFSDLIAREQELQQLVQQMEQDPNQFELIELYSKKQQRFEEDGGYSFAYKIDMMLSKFGFSKADFSRPIVSFSGGEQTKMAFVKLLLMEPNVLILDEPTNHLDLSTIEWLETYLANYQGTLLFVSHDRYFIDALATKIVEIEHKTLQTYKGNYEDYVEEKKLRYEQALKAYTLQQKEIARMKRFIEYYMPKPRFVSRAHDREKKLARIERLDKPSTSQRRIALSFQGESLAGKEILHFEDVALGFQTPLVEHVTFSLFGKQKLAIIGDNGSGKTTLLRVILNDLQPLSGAVTFHRLVKIGYIDQHHLDATGSQTILEDMLNEFPRLGEKELRNHLGKFNFTDDDYLKTLDVLSGGEKMRLMLSKIVLRNYDVLLLDEPTNHLDMVTRQALTLALQSYQGTIIFVSHDRYFVDEVATHLLYITHRRSYYFEGGYQEFKEKEKTLFEEEVEDSKKEEPKKEKKVANVSMSLQKLETKIAQLEEKLEAVRQAQFLEENYMDFQKMQTLEQQEKALITELKALEEQYCN